MNHLLALRLPVSLVGFVFCFVSLRYLNTHPAHLPLLLSGMTLVLVFIVVTALEARNLSYLRYSLSWMVAGWIGLLLFYVDSVYFKTPSYTGFLLKSVYLGCFLYASMIAVGVEYVLLRVHQDERALSRVFEQALFLWVLVAIVIQVNIIANERNQSWDVSYLKVTSPSDLTVQAMSKYGSGVEIALFFQRGNEVTPFVESYFNQLADRSKQSSIQYFDVDLNPSQSEKYLVSKNGQIVMIFGEKRERINVGTTLAQARQSIRKLDAEVFKILLRLTREKPRLYFSRGHSEISWLGGEGFESLGLLEQFLRSQNYATGFISVSEHSEIPDDAAAVVIVGPKEPFLHAEVEMIKRYLARGGRLMLWLDPNDARRVVHTKDPLRLFLEEGVGLEYKDHIMANDQVFLRLRQNASDHWLTVSNSFGSHESIKLLAENQERIGVLMHGAGYFDVTPEYAGWKSASVLRTMNSTFADLNRDYLFQEKEEKRQSYTVGVVSSKNFEGVDRAAQIVAFSSSSILTDVLLPNKANAVLVLEMLRWLLGEEDLSGTVESEEDVKLRQSNKEDAIWFNATIFGAPVLILVIGFFINRRGRRHV
jgi:hypothetical protein